MQFFQQTIVQDTPCFVEDSLVKSRRPFFGAILDDSQADTSSPLVQDTPGLSDNQNSMIKLRLSCTDSDISFMSKETSFKEPKIFEKESMCAYLTRFIFINNKFID